MLNFLFGPPGRRAAARDDWDRGWVTGRVRTQAGVVVDEELALTYATVWCCTRILSEACAALPLITYERTNEDDRRQAPELPVYDVLKNAPNEDMGSVVFREGRIQHQVNWGNGFAEIERQRMGDPESPVVALHPIHAGRVRPVCAHDQLPGYSYLVRNNDGTSAPLRRYEMLHIPGVLSDDGVWGKGVIPYARESIGFGIATERHGAAFFGAGGQPRGIVSGINLKDPEARKNFRAEWKELHASPDSGEIAILPIEAEYHQITIPNEAAQFLETRKENSLVICRWYRVPPHMAANFEPGQGYNSVEQFAIEFVIYSLLPWLRKFEEQCNLKLLARAERARYYCEHLLSSLLRGDMKARIDAYRIAIMTGIMTLNEARRLENLPGIGPAGDVHYVPLNMTTAERMQLGLDQPAASPAAGPGSDQDGAEPLTHAARDDLHGQITALECRVASQDHEPPAPLPASRERAERELLDQQQSAALISATRLVLIDRLTGLFRKESNAAKRISAAAFPAWLDTFQAKHAKVLTYALGPCCELLSALGRCVRVADLVARLIGDAKNQLLAAHRAGDLALVLESDPAARAARVADYLLEEKPCTP